MDSVKCHCCNGTGEIPLTGVYAETLAIVRRKCKGGNYLIAGQCGALFDCKETALNNRLAALERMGFLRSERFGRERRFYAK